MGDPTDDLADLWRWFADYQFRGYSPIYERVALAVAGDRDTVELLREAPPKAHLPPAPLAAVRYLLLEGFEHPLGEVYTGRSAADPGPLFLDACRRYRAEILALLETRRVQTNDCGRSALVVPALKWVGARLPGPFALIDVGASAGLNLRCDEYLLDYGEHGAAGPAASSVHVECEVIGGDPPIAQWLPSFVERVGIDLSPVDVGDPADARWLLACVWPDTGRVQRVAASIELARSNPPTVIQGHAQNVLPDVLDALPAGATAVVVTTWAFGYFSRSERADFFELLRDQSEHRTIAWISAEGRGTVEAVAGLAEADGGHADEQDADVLGAVIFDGGVATPHLLGYVQGHGNWIDWRAPS